MKKIYNLMICILLVLSICGCGSNSYSSSSPVYDNQKDIEIKLGNTQSQFVNISSGQYTRFVNELDYDNIECPYSDIFGISDAEREKNKYSFNVTTHTYDFFGADRQVSSEKLYDTVKRNNEAYLSEGVAKSLKKELSEKDLRKCCDVIAETINWGIGNIESFDFGRIGCILGNLKVVEKNSADYGDFDCVTNVLSLTPKNIENQNKKLKNIDYYKHIVSHETMHLMQCYCCDVEINDKDIFIGISYTFDNLQINPLRNRWLYEASAELNTALIEGVEPTTYQYMIENLETISLATVLNDNVKARQLEKISFSNDVKPLYKQLEFRNENKAKEFLYAIELLREKKEDFKEAYENKYGTIDGDYGEFLKLAYNPYFAEVTSKLFYKNLALKLKDSGMGINDVFYLISVYEMDLLNAFPLDNKTVRDKYPGMYNDYLALRNSFLDMVSEGAQTDAKELFSGYSANFEDAGVCANADLNWLDAEKTDYILYRNKALYQKYFKNIN